MLMWAPREPSTKSKLTKNGSPSREAPQGRRRVIWAKRSASSLAAPTARRTGSPGRGGTNSSGSNLVVWTLAASLTSAGRTPSSMRKTSLSNLAPSCRARTWLTTPYIRTSSPVPGTTRSRATTSSSCR